MTEAVRIIQREHRNLIAVLHCLSSVAGDIRTRVDNPEYELFHAIIDYLESFLDTFHHPKENEYLFRALRRRHPSAAQMLDELEAQHDQGEVLLAEMKAALAEYEFRGAEAYAAFQKTVDAYHDFEWEHMRREEMEAIPQARRYLTDEDWAEIDRAFASHEDPLFGAEPQERFRTLLSRIAAAAPAPYGHKITGSRA